jgi:hypothetical protein
MRINGASAEGRFLLILLITDWKEFSSGEHEIWTSQGEISCFEIRWFLAINWAKIKKMAGYLSPACVLNIILN